MGMVAWWNRPSRLEAAAKFYSGVDVPAPGGDEISGTGGPGTQRTTPRSRHPVLDIRPSAEAPPRLLISRRDAGGNSDITKTGAGIL